MSEVLARYHAAKDQLTAAGAPFALAERTLDGINYKAYADAPQSVSALLDAGRAHGDAVFLHYQGEEWRFDDFFAKADAVAAALVEQFAIKAGERIAIAMRNYPEWMLAYTAIANTGAVVVPLNSWWQRDELQYALNDSGARVVICDAQRAHALDGHINADIIVARPDADCPGTDIASLYQHAPSPALQGLAINGDDPAMIMYTSGTTGKPKGALSTQAAVCQTLVNFECAGMYSAMANPEYIEYMMGAGVAPVALLTVPLFHVSGCYPVFMMNLRAGRKVVMLYKWDAGEALRMVREQGVTILSGAPSMLQDLLRHPDFASTDTTHLSGVGAGGSAMSPTQVGELFGALQHPFPGSGYGMTETNGTGTTINGDALKEFPRSVGMATPIVDIKICDSEGKTLANGQRGEVWLKSPANARGYWNNPEASAETFIDGWVLSGDVGYLDDNGMLFIVDRIKDMVIRGGENIYCVEIEAVLAELGDVMEGAAFGIAHDKLGEEQAIMVRLQQHSTLDSEAIRAHFSARVAAYKVPSHIHIHDQPLPRNATGKVLKKELASLLQAVAR